MKSIAPAFFALFTAAAALAQIAPGSEGGAPANFDFDLLVVRLPEATALPLIPQLRDRRQSSGAAKKLVELVASKNAVLVGWPLLTAQNGQRAVAEQVDEVRYATEFDPPSHETINTAQAPGQAASNAQAQALGPPQPDQRTGEVTTSMILTGGIPTSFEARNVGVTLEVDGEFSPDGKAIRLLVAAQHVRLLGYRQIGMEEKGTGRKIVIEQPDFLVHKVTTTLAVQDGDHTLLGVFKVNDPPDQIELFVLHTQVRQVEAASPAAPEKSPTKR